MTATRDRSPSGRPGEPRDPYAGEGASAPPDSVGQALAQARQHGRAAVGESLAALQALVEATSLATRGRNADTSRMLGPVAKLFEGLIDDLGRDGNGAPRLLEAIAVAVDEEIERWQDRAVDDVEARTVLRAFLGLREVLWEIGVRRSAPRSRSRGGAPRTSGEPGGPRPARPRIQRVPVEG
jgi:hypothetical protein